MLNDKLLVSRAALLGDRKAFGQLVELYQSPIRRFILNLTDGDEELSKDLAQEVFIKAWLNISSFRALSRFSTWLYRIAYNTFYDNARNRKQTTDIDALAHNLVAEIQNKEVSLDITAALAVVNDYERTAILLFYMEDMTIDKIATIMECPKGTVKSHLSRGRNKIEVFLKESGY